MTWVGPTGCPAPTSLDYDCACAARGSWTFLEPGAACRKSGETLRFGPQKRGLWAQRLLRTARTQLSLPAPAPATLERGSRSDPRLCQARFSAQHWPSPNHCNLSLAIVGEMDALGDPTLCFAIN